jgi:YggT family protein
VHTAGFLVGTILWVINAITVLVVIDAVLSWFNPDRSNPIIALIDRISDAVCDPVRRLFPTVVGGFDLAPVIVIFVLQLVANLVRDLGGRWMY